MESFANTCTMRRHSRGPFSKMGNRTEKSPCYHTSQSLEMRELSHIAPFNGFTSVALTFNTVIPALQSRHCNPSGTDTFFLQALPAQCYASPVFVTANRWHQHTTQINVTIPTTMYGVAQKKKLSPGCKTKITANLLMWGKTYFSTQLGQIGKRFLLLTAAINSATKLINKLPFYVLTHPVANDVNNKFLQHNLLF